MLERGQRKRVLITIRTYPSPARKGIEISCTAGITESGTWIRLFPVPYRLMKPEQQFAKYQWIEADFYKANDPRPESFHPNVESIRVVSPVMSTAASWSERKQLIWPLK